MSKKSKKQKYKSKRPKYTTVGELMDLFKNVPSDTELFVEASTSKFYGHLFDEMWFELYSPRLGTFYTDIDGSTSCFLTFDLKKERAL